MEDLFRWVAAIILASALLAFAALVWRTRGLRRRLFLTLLLVALLPALAVGVVTWQETSDLGRLAESPGLRSSVDASVELAREVLDTRLAELARCAREGAVPAAPGYGWVEVGPSGVVREDGAAAGRGEELGRLRGEGRSGDGTLLYHEREIEGGRRVVAVSVLSPELRSRIEAAGEGAAGLRQLGLYYEQIARGRALVVAAGVLLLSVLLALLVSAALTNRLVRPVVDLAAATRRITSGEREFVVEVGGVDEVRELEHAFNDMTAQLAASEGKLRRSERLAAWQGIARRLAHEIKNPLTPIRLAVHRARERAGDEVVQEALGAIDEEARNLHRLAEEFSALGRLPEPRKIPIAVAPLVDEIAGLYLPEGVRLERSGDAVIAADEGQLRQVLSNLLKNASEATGASGRVTVAIGRERGWARIAVADDGVGLPEQPERIFEPEFTTRSSGTGLGLAIVRRIVEDHGGDISARPGPDGGACLDLRWPLAGGEESDA